MEELSNKRVKEVGTEEELPEKEKFSLKRKKKGKKTRLGQISEGLVEHQSHGQRFRRYG